MRITMMAVVAVCLVGTIGLSGQESSRPPVAKENQEPGGKAGEGKKTAYNAWTGDSRIRLRHFHAILFLPATNPDELQDAGTTRDKIGNLMVSFSRDYV